MIRMQFIRALCSLPALLFTGLVAGHMQFSLYSDCHPECWGLALEADAGEQGHALLTHVLLDDTRLDQLAQSRGSLLSGDTELLGNLARTQSLIGLAHEGRYCVAESRLLGVILRSLGALLDGTGGLGSVTLLDGSLQLHQAIARLLDATDLRILEGIEQIQSVEWEKSEVLRECFEQLIKI